MTHEAPALEVTALSAAYGAIPVLRSVDLRVLRGQVVTLIGANGAGKSTLMKCLSGLLRPSAGSVRLRGEVVTGSAPNQLVQHGVALVPEGRRLFGTMTVRENLDLGAYQRRDRREVDRGIERCLTLFPDLKSRLQTVAGTLSGGQQQMVAVARALMSQPSLLLLDEPTIGLAPAVVDLISKAIGEVRASGVDVLLVEQNAETALAISDYAYVVEAGRIVAEGAASTLANDDQVRRAYMGL